jgi:hypothetical protein
MNGRKVERKNIESAINEASVNLAIHTAWIICNSIDISQFDVKACVEAELIVLSIYFLSTFFTFGVLFLPNLYIPLKSNHLLSIRSWSR